MTAFLFNILLVYYESDGKTIKRKEILEQGFSRQDCFNYFDKYFKAGNYIDRFGKRIAFRQEALNIYISLSGTEKLWFEAQRQ